MEDNCYGGTYQAGLRELQGHGVVTSWLAIQNDLHLIHNCKQHCIGLIRNVLLALSGLGS